jgi:hypothetical protein
MTSQNRQHREARGQIIVLAALLMVILVGVTGLAIDVSAAYMADRWQRSVADAAALAGAQDLQKQGSRDLPGATEQDAARKHAMDVLVSEMGASSTPSVASGSPCIEATGCPLPGTPYEVAVRTPSPSFVDCDPDPAPNQNVSSRCMQVTIRQPSFGLTFARIFGQNSWTVSSSSVAGRIYARQYGIVTLRPPKDSRGTATANSDDLFVTGGSKVVVGQADIATNTNVVCSGIDSEINLDTGFRIYHFDGFEAWTSGSGRCLNPPSGSQLTTPIEDPQYPIPTRVAGIPTFNSLEGAVDSAKEPDSAKCLAEQAKVPSEYHELKTNMPINDPTKVTATCVRPGIYRFTLEAKDPSSGLPDAILLEPGVYFFDYGVRVQSSFIGGYEPGVPGVALVFKEAFNTSGDPGQFTTTNNTSLVALNFGNLYCPGPAGTTCSILTPPREWAAPANGPQGPVATTGDKPILMTVMVVPDPNCAVGIVEPGSCDSNKNKTVSLDGGGNIFLAGVQYAPTDNSTLSGNSGQKAEIGAFWSWTVAFKGGTEFRLASALPDLTGVLRLDPACSPTVNVCNP